MKTIIYPLVILSCTIAFLGCGSSGPLLQNRVTTGIAAPQVSGIETGAILKKGENRASGHMSQSLNNYARYNYGIDTIPDVTTFQKVSRFSDFSMGGDMLFGLNDHIALGFVGDMTVGQYDVVGVNYSFPKEWFYNLQVGGVVRLAYEKKKFSFGGAFAVQYCLQNVHEYSYYYNNTEEVLTENLAGMNMTATTFGRYAVSDIFSWYLGVQFRFLGSQFYLPDRLDYTTYEWTEQWMTYTGVEVQLNDLVGLNFSYALPFGGVLSRNDVPLMHTVTLGINFNWLRKKYRNNEVEVL